MKDSTNPGSVARKERQNIIRWTFDKRLGENHTLSIMAKFRQRINSAFYIRYIYAYVIVNTETDLKMVYYK